MSGHDCTAGQYVEQSVVGLLSKPGRTTMFDYGWDLNPIEGRDRGVFCWGPAAGRIQGDGRTVMTSGNLIRPLRGLLGHEQVLFVGALLTRCLPTPLESKIHSVLAQVPPIPSPRS